MIIQPIIDLVAICAKKGIEHAILSPGSRCAPLTLAFVRHPDIHARTISDERSAAFIALGMAQQLEKPVALVCTSGSAALNYYPAVAEAFFQQIPLLILTADRPPEWIDQWDGQTIYQQEVYGKHVKKSFQFPDDFSNPDKVWHAARIANEAINLAQQFPAGPVHINIPLREPFYPSSEEKFEFPDSPREFTAVHSHTELSPDSLEHIKNRLLNVKRLMIVPGQQKPDSQIQGLLDDLIKKQHVVVVADTISNIQGKNSISLHDHWLGNEQLQAELAPDLVISFGKSVISKSLKQFLRKQEISHWHIQPDGQSKDTYQHLTRILACTPSGFLNWLSKNLPVQSFEFARQWNRLEEKVGTALPEVMDQVGFGEYAALHLVLKKIPTLSKIHLANSMAVRYVNFLGKRTQEICCNRGTSGIDGSTSTAVGCTFTTKEPVSLITGDMAFFYDRNAFWHNYPMNNLRVIILNNHAGGIFRIIEGPASQPELEEFFETKQSLNAKSLAAEFGFEYSKAESKEELRTALEKFYSSSIHPKILEIFSESASNLQILKDVKKKINKLISEV
ncbi:2-succinyl-5-enolpyruvyl-6-hydroxy-3-cyclohexene-1-carboxylic-acid synthase [Algoriphagus hitonicola]|uniref:2-succinyl-5-enolpyruvyl-6-hydroxy-3- cyclohexene-1-carboxylic-acid synthase n=1 Tax=Algoriphagus hitonicola TaxID=435880 RepID=UPI000B82EBE1|nr:2-succinyl-5-enolpyruvyl-6-hydroxy-3-cyclohexene-1-carboxylic-acid synthase [Algoriphagus hitonicola]